MPDLGEFLAEGTINCASSRSRTSSAASRWTSTSTPSRATSTASGVEPAPADPSARSFRQISRLGPARLILLDRDESGLYYLNQELRREDFYDAEVFVGDVTIPERVSFVFERFRPQLVFHAAAYKHVPMMELQATEAITNNVLGTSNIVAAAGAYGAASSSTSPRIRPSTR